MLSAFSQLPLETKTMSTEQALKINIPGSDNALVNIVRAFVRQRYHLVDDDQADICIIDLDAYKAKSLLDTIRERYPIRPIIGLSLNDVDDDTIVHLKKPFRPDDLSKVLESVKANIATPKVVVSRKTEGSLHHAAQAVTETKLSSERHVAHTGVTNRINTVHYNPAEFLQGTLINAYHKASNTGLVLRLEAWWNPIFIFPKQRKIWVDADNRQLQAYCQLPLTAFARRQASDSNAASQVKISPEPMLSTKDFPGPLESMDVFLWKVSWWNAGGLLPKEIDENQSIQLKYWPNITRYLCPEHVVQICALLYQGAISPFRIVEVLELEHKEVYGFISAANALGLIDIKQRQRKKDPETAKKTKPAPTKPRNAGLLRRILSHIKKH